MVEEGLLLERAAPGSRRGRRGVAVNLNPEFGHLVGFDMEALRLRAVVVDFAGQLVWQKRKNLAPTRTGDELISEVLGFLDGAVKEARLKYKNLLGVGLAASGVIQTGGAPQCPGAGGGDF